MSLPRGLGSLLSLLSGWVQTFRDAVYTLHDIIGDVVKGISNAVEHFGPCSIISTELAVVGICFLLFTSPKYKVVKMITVWIEIETKG